MSTAAAVKAQDSRQRFIDAAIRLFTRHSFAGTSLQMIADEVGVTKAAVYHHFRTREELLAAVIEPLVTQMRESVEAAEAQRTAHARADTVLTGFVDLVVRNQDLIPVFAGDPGTVEMLRSQHNVEGLVERQVALLEALDPTPAGKVRAAVALAGIACSVGPSRLAADFDPETLRPLLLDAGRRTLGLRAPRRPQ
ncbi:TetR/AcrR family transcriptional regulator [Phytohabitans rumicis]|uniref:TetR family transcriptional regulator n=1 Tax=Phytohabitans rumicis TaxID=1076125 RepID=A0A6V8LL85_9ACTN|nr:TetR/AcrR family transcriptional regulator [Phytohabitans rumicis]GFJ94817.1 TetR family transcriptional regulator [Phytohabitans rumicis]